MTTENNMKEGIIFKSSASGLWYQNKDAAGDVSAVRVDGVVFEKKETIADGINHCDEHGGYGSVRDCKICNKSNNGV